MCEHIWQDERTTAAAQQSVIRGGKVENETLKFGKNGGRDSRKQYFISYQLANKLLKKHLTEPFAQTKQFHDTYF